MTNAKRRISRPYYRAGFTGWFRGFFRETIPSTPGTVTGAWIQPTVRGAWSTASVEGGFATATVRGSVIPLNNKE